MAPEGAPRWGPPQTICTLGGRCEAIPVYRDLHLLPKYNFGQVPTGKSGKKVQFEAVVASTSL